MSTQNIANNQASDIIIQTLSFLVILVFAKAKPCVSKDYLRFANEANTHPCKSLWVIVQQAPFRAKSLLSLPPSTLGYRFTLGPRLYEGTSPLRDPRSGEM